MSRDTRLLRAVALKLSNNLHFNAMIATIRLHDAGKLADTIAWHTWWCRWTRSRTCSRCHSRRSSASTASPASQRPRSTSSRWSHRHPVSASRSRWRRRRRSTASTRRWKGMQKELGTKGEKGNKDSDELPRRRSSRPGCRRGPGKANQELEAARGRCRRCRPRPPVSRQLPRLWLIAVPAHEKNQGEPRPQARRGSPQQGPLRPR